MLRIWHVAIVSSTAGLLALVAEQAFYVVRSLQSVSGGF